MMKTEAVQSFLRLKTHSDLSALYSASMEVQVNVARDGGKQIDAGELKGRSFNAFTDGETVWKPFRIPFKAKTEPEYTDSPIKFSIEKYAEGIGMTGWDWVAKKSRWVAFDFDAILGHSDRHGKKLDDRQLSEIQDVVKAVPFVTLRRSTSGKGLHLYIHLEPVDTQNHTEHAALARSVLAMLSGLCGYDFTGKVDICGGNMWVWHRKMTAENGGLKLLKQGDKLRTVPANWRDHLTVTRRQSNRAVPDFVSSIEDDAFNDLVGKRNTVALDVGHRALMEWLANNGCVWWWDQDAHSLVTHTYHLKEAHTALKMCGAFDTLAVGSDRGADHNCFGGDTEVLTQQGPKHIRDLVGITKLYVKTNKGMEWLDCEIKSFGKQKTYHMQFGNKSSCRSTDHHEWLQVNSTTKLYTYQLTKKHYLPLAPILPEEPDMEGYAHGFVFGDGWLEGKNNSQCDVTLFKRDIDLMNLLCRYGQPGTQKVHGEYVNVVRQLPKHWKELPINPTKAYALGFILGLMSADGFVHGDIQLFQSDWSILEQCREWAIYCGLRVNMLRQSTPAERKVVSGKWANAAAAYELSINTYNIKPEWILRKDQRTNLRIRTRCTSMTVKHIDWQNPIEEEVFCAVVPIYHNFTLANGVITGNCFCFPIRNSSWAVRRYGPGTGEHQSWQQDGNNWTLCYLNRNPDFVGVARLNGGVESEKGGYVFRHAEHAQRVLLSFGVNLSLPNFVMARKTIVKVLKEGKIVVHIEAEDSDDGSKMNGWLQDKKLWRKVINVKLPHNNDGESNQNYDDMIRHITSNDTDAGWVIKKETSWVDEPLAHVRAALSSFGEDAKLVSQVIGSSVMKAWTLVNKPFQPEYPGNREWNRNAAQLAVAPTLDLDNLNYLHWSLIMNHLGSNLSSAIVADEWCKSVGLTTGADFLMLWIASLIRRPDQPSTYLSFFGSQDCGKSIFHEAISEILLTKGVVRADNALQSQGNFNGELENAVLCVVEETDLSANKVAYNRIKDWVTSPYIMIRPLYSQGYMSLNCTHWVQCTNGPEGAPVFPGDSRITMVHVPDLKTVIPKLELKAALRKEAPDFLAALLAIELPASNSRLAVPTIETEVKRRAMDKNMSMMERFFRDKAFEIPGTAVPSDEIHEQMQLWLDDKERAVWSQNKIGREMPDRFPKGRLHGVDNQKIYYGNLTFDADQVPGKKYISRKMYLEFEETTV